MTQPHPMNTQDLVERLNTGCIRSNAAGAFVTSALLSEAASRIQALEAENAELREERLQASEFRPELLANPFHDEGRENKANASERLRLAYVIQQRCAPDQMAVVWRRDLGTQRHHLLGQTARADIYERYFGQAEFLLALMAACAEGGLNEAEDALVRIQRADAETLRPLAARAQAAETQAASYRKALEDWDWFSGQISLSLDYGYPDELDEGVWQAHRVSGGVNDREWTLVGSGATALEAIQDARTALSKTDQGEGGR